MKDYMKQILLITLLTIVLAGCMRIDRGEGTLMGHVTIGPLVPVLREGEQEPTPSPELFAAWQIVIYTEDIRREVARAEIDAQGDYQIILPVGAYLVTAAPTSGLGGPGGAAQYPVEITQDAITRLDLDIDTGIR